MAAHPVLSGSDGAVRIPEKLQQDPRYQDGAQLELVPVMPNAAGNASPGGWRPLRGMFRDSEVNLNAPLDKDRLAEIALDERMIGGNLR